MRIPLPLSLDRSNGDRGLALGFPSVSASPSDDSATTITLGDHSHRIPSTWQVAEGQSGEHELVFLQQGSRIVTLVGTRDGVREIAGYNSTVRDAIRRTRFGTPEIPAE